MKNIGSSLPLKRWLPIGSLAVVISFAFAAPSQAAPAGQTAMQAHQLAFAVQPIRQPTQAFSLQKSAATPAGRHSRQTVAAIDNRPRPAKASAKRPAKPAANKALLLMLLSALSGER